MKPEHQIRYESLVFKLGAACLGKTKGRSMVGKWAKEKHSFEEIGETFISALEQNCHTDIAYLTAILNKQQTERVEAKKLPFVMRTKVQSGIVSPGGIRGLSDSWTTRCEGLLAIVGNAAYSAWFNDMWLERLEKGDEGLGFVVSFPTEFIRDKVSGGLLYSQLREALDGAPLELTVRNDRPNQAGTSIEGGHEAHPS